MLISHSPRSCEIMNFSQPLLLTLYSCAPKPARPFFSRRKLYILLREYRRYISPGLHAGYRKFSRAGNDDSDLLRGRGSSVRTFCVNKPLVNPPGGHSSLSRVYLDIKFTSGNFYVSNFHVYFGCLMRRADALSALGNRRTESVCDSVQLS